ncbi:citrate lyase subunit alpha [Ectobacillus funiculus]
MLRRPLKLQVILFLDFLYNAVQVEHPWQLHDLLEKKMIAKDMKASFALGGITGQFVEMQKEGLISNYMIHKALI